MGKATDNHFKKKEIWTAAKDDLLKHYLSVYMAKVFHTGRRIIYLDCFAGAGKFGQDDVPYNEKLDGSPLIALAAIQEALYNTKAKNPKYFALFIEPNHHKALEANIKLSQYATANYKLYNGSYPEEMKNVLSDILKSDSSSNLFCYLDPFGIKYLLFDTFKFIKRQQLHSLEFLINFNSFGFLRYACGAWAIKVDIREGEISEAGEVTEIDPLREERSEDALVKLDEIMGTNEWREIIEDYRLEKLGGYEAEAKLASLYKKQLKQVLGFKYVLSIPIRLKDSIHPKYRMIYATDHCQGAKIMGEVMCKQQDYLHDQHMLSSSGCPGLFSREDLYALPSIEQCVVNFLKDKGELGGDEFIASFYDEMFLTSKLNETLKSLEESDKINIRRIPPFTKAGKPRRFFTERPGYQLYISLKT